MPFRVDTLDLKDVKALHRCSPVRSRNGDCALLAGGADRSSTSSRSVTGLSFDAYNSTFVLNRRINVESVMFRFLFLIESLRFFSGLFV
jgi:hypothetical protein